MERSRHSTETAGRLLRSSGAAAFSQLWRVGFTFVTRMILRRLLEPAAWGLWHWSVDSVFLLLAQVRDLGLPAQVARVRPRPYGNFLAVEAVWGGTLGLLVLVGSPWLGRAYSGGLAASSVVRLLVLFLVLEGLARVPLTFFEAELLVGRAVVPELVRNFCWAVLSVVLALAGYGVWSLIIAHVVATGLFAAILWARALPRMSLTWIRAGTWRMVRGGLPLRLIALLLLLLGALDLVILGTRFPGETLGRYGAALELALLVTRILDVPIRRPLLPALVAFRGDPDRFSEAYRLTTVFLFGVQVPIALFLLGNAETVLTLLWGRQYADAAPFLRILCLGLLLQPFGRCAEDVLLARHEERLLIAAAALNLISLATLGILLTARIGPVGMAWAHLLPLGEILLGWAIWQSAPTAFRRLVRDLAWVYLAPLPLFLVAFAAGSGRPELRLALSLAAGAGAAIVYVRRFGRGYLSFFGPSQ